MRKLVTIRKIDSIHPIPKADRIEIITIGGWSCIAKKGEFKVNDFCVYFEIDSFLPDTPAYSFLGSPKTHQGKLGHRIRTMKMRGVVSQGLALPVSNYPELQVAIDTRRLGENDDITDMMEVFKYDIDLPQGGSKTPSQRPRSSEGRFPSFIPKTDQERIQNVGHYFSMYKDTEFEETLKLDGSSMTCYRTLVKPSKLKQLLNNITFGLIPSLSKESTKFGVCSRNLELKKPVIGGKQCNFWNAVYKYNIQESIPVGYAIQGELLAPSIQGNYEKVDEVEFYIFDIYNIKEQRYLNPLERTTMMEGRLSAIPHVPVVNKSVKIFSECTSFEDILARASGQSLNSTQPISEGRVYKSFDSNISFKCINNSYLLQKSK